MMEWMGLLMLVLVAAVLVATGLPAFMVLIGIASIFAVLGIAASSFTLPILYALPNRIVGLLETDLLQALPLYVLMGVLLNRLPIADILFRAGDRGLRRTGAAPQISAMGLGALLAPMNGSVGASVSTLSHVVRPRLLARGVAPEQSLATVIVASTLGVVIPPSLVLILLADAMMRAHTQAATKTAANVRIVNTQDVFLGSLTPAAIFFVFCLLISWAIAWRSRRQRGAASSAPTSRLNWREWLAAAITVIFIVVLLAGVTIGYFYAVEAAAMGAFALFTFGLLSGALKPAMISTMLRDAMAVTGALLALLAAATTFTLVFRAFGTDLLLDRLIADLPGGPTGTAIVVLLVLALSAFVLDAFELIFVVVPVVMPALLTRVPDAVWVSVATLLVLQASFLIPPFGYAVMMARTMMARGSAGGRSGHSVPIGPLARSLAPYLAAQLLVLALIVAFPGIAHFASPPGGNASALTPVRSDEDTRKQFDNIMPNSGEDEPPPPPKF